MSSTNIASVYFTSLLLAFNMFFEPTLMCINVIKSLYTENSVFTKSNVKLPLRVSHNVLVWKWPVWVETCSFIKHQQEGQGTYNVTSRRVREILLLWESDKYHLLVCACVHALACMWVPGRVSVCMRVSACSLPNPARSTYAPYCDVTCGIPPPLSH